MPWPPPVAGDPDATAADSGQEDDDVLGPGGEPSRSAVRPAAPDFALADVMTIRLLYQPRCCRWSCCGRRRGTSPRWNAASPAGDQAASYEEFEAWDLALHRGIIAAAHSPLLVALYGVGGIGTVRAGLGRSQAPQCDTAAARALPAGPPGDRGRPPGPRYGRGRGGHAHAPCPGSRAPARRDAC